MSSKSFQNASKLNGIVSVLQFGVVGNGVTDDTIAIQAAIDSLGDAGGTIVIPNGMRCVLDSTLIVRSNVGIQGPNIYVGNPTTNAGPSQYNEIGGAFLLSGTQTITMQGGSSLSGLLIYRKGMTFPQTTVSGWTGTAITAAGDDVSVENCMILGFDKAFYSNSFQRARLTSLYMDNTNGIEIASCYDIARVSDCHSWPFTTVAAHGSGAPAIRSGNAYTFISGGDWNNIRNCFSYGYNRGLLIEDCSDITAIGCGFDNVPSGHPSAIGIVVRGTSDHTKLIGCQTAANGEAGVYVDVNPGSNLVVNIENLTVWGLSTHGILVDSGDAVANGCTFKDVANVLTVTNNLSKVVLDNSYMKNISALMVNATVATTNILIGKNNVCTNFGGDPTSNLSLPAIASASVVLLSNTGSQFYITGTTNIGNLLHAWAGRVVTLIFPSALTVLDSQPGAGPIRLNNNANFTTQAGSTLTLVGVGGEAWNEIGRCF